MKMRKCYRDVVCDICLLNCRQCNIKGNKRNNKNLAVAVLFKCSFIFLCTIILTVSRLLAWLIEGDLGKNTNYQKRKANYQRQKTNERG